MDHPFTLEELLKYSRDGRLMELLQRIPETSWADIIYDKDDRINEKDWSLLHFAAHGNDPDAIKALVAADVGLEWLSASNETALQVASRYRCLASMEALLEAGADIYVRDWEGRGLLHDVVNYYYEHRHAPYLNHPANGHTDRPIDFARLLFRYGLTFDNSSGWSGEISQEMLRWQDDWRRGMIPANEDHPSCEEEITITLRVTKKEYCDGGNMGEQCQGCRRCPKRFYILHLVGGGKGILCRDCINGGVTNSGYQ